tara:strand:- start:254 stop:427 length:174 start_codon:yes stop_codon:yes gene_type:complete
MKVGDLVRLIKPFYASDGEKLYLITKAYGTSGLYSLCSFSSNQVFRKEQLEVVSASR